MNIYLLAHSSADEVCPGCALFCVQGWTQGLSQVGLLSRDSGQESTSRLSGCWQDAVRCYWRIWGPVSCWLSACGHSRLRRGLHSLLPGSLHLQTSNSSFLFPFSFPLLLLAGENSAFKGLMWLIINLPFAI